MARHLTIFHLGPVQDFIATARRSRDLWFGSWLLSELAKTAAKQVDPKFLIFPNHASVDDAKGSNAPNKIVVISDIDPRVLGKKVKDAVQSRLKELAASVLMPLESQINLELANKQIEDLLEIFWVSVPVSSEEHYANVRDQAEALLAARKLTRNFSQALGDNSYKSSLDGARESVIPDSLYPVFGDPNKIEKSRNLYNRFHARPGERLSGVDLLKRLGEAKSAPKFRSTSHMAALPFLQGLGEKKAADLIAKLRAAYEAAQIRIKQSDDGALLYESRLSDSLPVGPDQNLMRKKINEILNASAGKSRPNPYYALLAADGDNMGVLIDAQRTIESHRKLSAALSDFAGRVPSILQEHEGVLIYAGGDDVLALLPLHTALSCAAKLEKTFKQNLASFNGERNGKAVSASLSVGLIIAHHLDPLSDALDLARQAEKKAKNVKGKNGLAITLSKRSGVDRTIYGKWGELDLRLGRLIEFSKAGGISAGTAYEFRDLDLVLRNSDVPSSGKAAEAVRIVARKREKGGEQVISDEVREAFRTWINPVDENSTVSLDELANEMIIAKMLAGSDQNEKLEESL